MLESLCLKTDLQQSRSLLKPKQTGLDPNWMEPQGGDFKINLYLCCLCPQIICRLSWQVYDCSGVDLTDFIRSYWLTAKHHQRLNYQEIHEHMTTKLTILSRDNCWATVVAALGGFWRTLGEHFYQSFVAKQPSRLDKRGHQVALCSMNWGEHVSTQVST